MYVLQNVYILKNFYNCLQTFKYLPSGTHLDLKFLPYDNIEISYHLCFGGMLVSQSSSSDPFNEVYVIFCVLNDSILSKWHRPGRQYSSIYL